MIRTLTCKTCGREIIGVEWHYGSKWTCSDCAAKIKPNDVLGCERGSYVVLRYPENGTDSDKEMVEKYLKKDELYTVEFLTIGGYQSEVELKQFPGIKFNSIHFERIVKGLRRYRIHVEETALINER